MQSDGGLTPTDRFIGSRAVLSGPAGGVVGYAMTTREEEEGPSTTSYALLASPCASVDVPPMRLMVRVAAAENIKQPRQGTCTDDNAYV